MASSSSFEGSASRVVRAVLVVDVAESVRLIEQYEDETVARWRAFVHRASEAIVPMYDGRLVKSLGDGLMLEFPHALNAVRAAFDLHAMAAEANQGYAPERHILLRMGAHVSSMIADDLDIYGHGVNLAVRLTSLAHPGEVVASAEVCDLLAPVIDADIEDLGECFLKHISRPVRAYRVGPPGVRPALDAHTRGDDLRATVAVVPFTSHGGDVRDAVLGHIVADDVITSLSRSSEINVVSRLSSAAFDGRETPADVVGGHLNARYVIAGAYRVQGDKVALHAELTDVQAMQVAWSATLRGSVERVVAGSDGLAERLVADASAALMVRELRRSQGMAPATLEGHTLLLSSITLMHRMSPQATVRAQLLLHTLIERAPRVASPYAWLAKWHVLRVTQGWSTDPQDDRRKALDNTRRALDLDPTSSLALTVEGQVNTYMDKQLDVAEQRYDAALRENPNDSLAWLLKGTLHAFRGEGRAAVRHTRHAQRLSPLDPLRYYFDALAASAALSAGQYPRALALAERSLRMNRTHASTLRVMVVALVQLGRDDDARARTADLMQLQPALTISKYVAGSPSAAYPIGRLIADSLRHAGVPQ